MTAIAAATSSVYFQRQSITNCNSRKESTWHAIGWSTLR